MAALASSFKDHTMAEFCTNCGAPLSGVFCGRCGSRAQSASAPPQPSVPTPQSVAAPTAQPVAPTQPAASPQSTFQQPSSHATADHGSARCYHATAAHNAGIDQRTTARTTICRATTSVFASTLYSSAKVFWRRQSFAHRRRNCPGVSSRCVWRGALWRPLGQRQSIFYYRRIVWL